MREEGSSAKRNPFEDCLRLCLTGAPLLSHAYSLFYCLSQHVTRHAAPGRNRCLSHGLKIPRVEPETVIPGHKTAYLLDMHHAHHSQRIGNMDPIVSGHETAAGIPHAVPTSNSGHQVTGPGTQHHGDWGIRSASGWPATSSAHDGLHCLDTWSDLENGHQRIVCSSSQSVPATSAPHPHPGGDLR